MATIVKYKIDGQETTPFREARNVAINAVFGEEVQADLSISEVNFVDSAEGLNAKKVKELFLERPTEGHDFSYSVLDGSVYKDFNFFMDYRTIKFLADNELSVGMIKDSSLNQFNDRAQGITMRLLEYNNILTSLDYQPFPYVVENRKTELEKIQLLAQAFQILRTIVIEVRNIINIASDLPTIGGALPAAANLAFTLLSIPLLFQQLIDLLQQIQEAFFPIPLYHAAIKPKTFIEKAVINKMGYSGVEFGNYGNWPQIIEQETWCGSKNQEIGRVDSFAVVNSGILNPANEGYNLFDCKELLKRKYRLREAVIDDVYHLRPEQDTFWLSNGGYVMPNVLVEQTLAGNGTFRPNYEDAWSNYIVQYQTDDSDLHTLDDLIDSEDDTSTGKIISVTTVEPINVNSQRKVLLNQGKILDIPYALAVRKDEFDDLFDLFNLTGDIMNDLKSQIEQQLLAYSSILGASNPVMEEFVSNLGSRTGTCKVENHFFSVPKVALLEDNLSGNPVIVENFADIIGAKALYENHLSYDSFIPGNRNPNNLNETAGKYVYENVRIPFGLQDFVTVLNNAYFTTENGETGKFISLDWTIDKDEAIVSYWVYNSWLTNIEENIA